MIQRTAQPIFDQQGQRCTSPSRITRYYYRDIPPREKLLEDLLEYLPRSTIVHYKRGQIVYSLGRPPEGLYLVVDGIIKVSRLLENGDQVIVDIYQADELFGESALLAGESQAEQATALDKARLMIWSARQIRDLILNRPGLGWALMQTLVWRAMGLTERIESFARDNTACRLARTLLRFCERFGVLEKDGALRMASLTHMSLADCVGTSREVITSYMRQFQREGYLRYSRKYIVVYPNTFKEWLRQNKPLMS
jgi:CRP/FNR family cyclic AMP-dependent transcriptional regulator